MVKSQRPKNGVIAAGAPGDALVCEFQPPEYPPRANKTVNSKAEWSNR
jgi:hypothetical protein